MVATVITNRDEQLLFALARAVRFFSLNQIARTWWTDTPSGTANARRRLRQLTSAGLLDSERIFAEELPQLDSPVVSWEPGQSAPDAGAVAWKLQSRWTKAPRPITAFYATSRLANRYGGQARGRISHPDQASHDLGLSEMYLSFFARHPTEVEHWIGEDIFAAERKGQKLPDAVLRNEQGEVYRVLEFGGAYDAMRVEAFHLDNERRRLPYELW